MSAVAGRSLLRLSVQACSRGHAARIASRSLSCFQINHTSDRGAATRASWNRCGEQLGSGRRQLCDQAEEKFEDRLIYTIRLLSDQRKLKDGVMDDVIALIRDAMVQQDSQNPDNNEELETRMEQLGDNMVYVAGMFLIMAADKLGPRCMSLAAPFLRKASFMGHTGAKYTFARLTLDGMGVEQDQPEAVRLFREIADSITDKSEPYAQTVFTLGTLHFYGKGVDVDTQQALAYFDAALDAGLTQAFHTLGMLYMRGDGVTVDQQKALGYYRRGAEQDDARCLNELATCHLTGAGVEKDAKKATEMYHDAAQLGNSNAMHSLGVCYWEGRGVDLDQDKAAYWWSQAADVHHPRACVNLAQLYLDGVGVKKDTAMARSLLQEAARRGLPEAGQLLEEMETRLKEDPSLDS